MIMIRRAVAWLATAAAVAAAMLVGAGTAAATTDCAPSCSGGRIQLEVTDGPGDSSIRVVQRARSADGYLIQFVQNGFTWRNERTGRTGSVPRENDTVLGSVAERTYTINTESGNVVVEWDRALVYEYRGATTCFAAPNLRAQAIARA